MRTIGYSEDFLGEPWWGEADTPAGVRNLAERDARWQAYRDIDTVQCIGLKGLSELTDSLWRDAYWHWSLARRNGWTSAEADVAFQAEDALRSEAERWRRPEMKGS